ncbi:hypothetical protein C0J52_28187 [Blattella germanica]|nr:hypothetical protein C0J52_28187 [Blattella germanica]
MIEADEQQLFFIYFLSSPYHGEVPSEMKIQEFLDCPDNILAHVILAYLLLKIELHLRVCCSYFFSNLPPQNMMVYLWRLVCVIEFEIKKLYFYCLY